MITVDDRTAGFRRIVEDVAKVLSAVRHEDGASLLRTPVLYPGGSMVVVRIAEAGERFLVSDMGLGYQEADLMGAASIFTRATARTAERAGVEFDYRTFFLPDVRREQLPGAVAT